MAVAAGIRLGPYEIVEPLGIGAAGGSRQEAPR